MAGSTVLLIVLAVGMRVNRACAAVAPVKFHRLALSHGNSRGFGFLDFFNADDAVCLSGCPCVAAFRSVVLVYVYASLMRVICDTGLRAGARARRHEQHSGGGRGGATELCQPVQDW